MRLVSFGCSLSRQGCDNIEYPNYYDENFPDTHTGVIRTLSRLSNLEYVNYSLSSASAEIIINRFNQYMINDYKKDDVIIWQMTSYERKSYELRIKKSLNKKFIKSEIGIDIDNFLKADYYVHNDCWDDDYYSVSLLSHNSNVDKVFYPDYLGYKSTHYRHEKNLINTLAAQKTIKLLGNKLLVWFGWEGALYDYNKKYEDILKKENITYIPERYLEWAISNNLPQLDSVHPCPFKAAPIYAEKVLYPELKRIIEAT